MSLRKKIKSMNRSLSSGFNNILPGRGSRSASPMPDAPPPASHTPQNDSQTHSNTDIGEGNPEPTTTERASISSPETALVRVSNDGDGAARASEWTYLDRLKRVLDRSSDALGPLRAVVDEFAASLATYQASEGRSEFRKLQAELEFVFQQLAGWYSSDTPPALNAAYIHRELAYVKEKRERSPARRLIGAEPDGDQVLACYRRVQGHLQQLTLNASMSMWKNSDELTANARLDRLSPSYPSVYNSNQAAELRRGACTPGTRVDVLAYMHDWIDGRDAGSIFWLNGMAGTGKTTIAYSLCAQLALASHLGASFFCSRLLPECRDVNRIVPSIAYQLAQYSSPFRHALLRVLETDRDVHTQLLCVQFEKLVAKPLEDVGNTIPGDLVVVIDALDECDSKSNIQQFLETLLRMTPGLPIKFILASRPEPEIRDVMKRPLGRGEVSKLVLHELDKGTVQGDVETYLRAALQPINPSESDILALVERADILFIYAAAVVRYISFGNFSKNPLGRLEDVLSGLSTGRSNPYKEVDELYNFVLEAAFHDPDSKEEDCNDTEQVLYTVLCVREPLGTDALRGLLGWHNVDRVHAALAPLWSVLHILESNGLATTLHASFRDYLFNPSRSKRFHCDPTKRNHTLAKCCFKCLETTKPQINICGLESSCVPDRSVPDLEARIETEIPVETLYACQYWEQHLQSTIGSSELFECLDNFFSSQLLLWVEIVNLNGYLTTGVEMLRRTEGWCVRHACTEDLKQLVHDAWRFMSVFTSSPVSQSTPHIYVSMLPCWPTYCPIAKHYGHLIQKVIRGTAIASRSLALLAAWPMGKRVNSLKWSPDSTCIAFISNGQIFVSEPLSGRPILGPLSPRALLDDSRYAAAYGITSIGYSPDGTRIVSGSEDGTIYVWGSKTGYQLREVLKGHTRRINSVTFSPDNRDIASGSEDSSIHVWDARTGEKRLGSLIGHSGPVMSVTFSPDCARIVSGSDDRTLRLWDVQTGQLALGPLQGHTDSVSLVVCSPDGTCIASGSHDKTVRIWNAQTGESIAPPFEGHTGPVHSVAFSPDGTRIISGSEDKTIRMWDSQNGELIANPFQGHTGAVSSVAFSPDGTRFASASNDKSIRMWDARAEQPELNKLLAHTGYVSSVAFSPNGGHIASSSQDKTIRMWDGHSGKFIPGPLQEHVGLTMSVAFSPDGTLIASGSQNNTVQVRDVQTGQPKLDPLKAHTKPVSSVAFSPDGTRIISGSYDKTIRMWNAYTGSPMLGALRGHTDIVLSVAFSPEGARIASGSDDKTVRIWQTATGEPIIGPLEGHTDAITSVAFSPDGTQIASGSFDGTIRTWDAKTGLSLKSFNGHGGSVFSVAFSPDGTSLVSGSYDKTVRIWGTQTGQPLLGPFEGHTNGVSAVSFSSDGARIVSGSFDHTIRAWDARAEVHMASGSPLAPPFSWELAEDGWVVASDNRSNLLAWVPPDLRHLLLPPRALFVTSEDGYIRLDFESAQIGASWTEFYKPHVLGLP